MASHGCAVRLALGGAETTLAAFERFEDNGGLFATDIFSQPL